MARNSIVASNTHDIRLDDATFKRREHRKGEHSRRPSGVMAAAHSVNASRAASRAASMPNSRNASEPNSRRNSQPTVTFSLANGDGVAAEGSGGGDDGAAGGGGEIAQIGEPPEAGPTPVKAAPPSRSGEGWDGELPPAVPIPVARPSSADTTTSDQDGAVAEVLP